MALMPSWDATKLPRTGEGNGSPLQCSRLENPRDGGAWWPAVCGVAQSRTRRKWFSSSSKREHETTRWELLTWGRTGLLWALRSRAGQPLASSPGRFSGKRLGEAAIYFFWRISHKHMFCHNNLFVVSFFFFSQSGSGNLQIHSVRM